MGLSSSSDKWCRHSDRVVEGFPWCRKIVDDILIWAASPSELEDCFSKVVQRCEDLHVILSKSKFQVDTCLNFAGCVVSPSGVKPDPARIEFPYPNGSDVGLFLPRALHPIGVFCTRFPTSYCVPSSIDREGSYLFVAP